MKKENLQKEEVAPEEVTPMVNPDDVRKAIGEDVLAKLGSQPLAIALGGIEKALKMAITKCAGHPDPVAAAVRELRVSCGSSAEPKKLNPES